jgi:hypothetical protein
MTGSGKTIGIILIVVGIIIGIVIVAFMAAGIAQEEMELGGAILGFGLGLIIVLPMVGAGIFLMIKGGKEDAELAQIRKQRQILDMVKTQSKVSISDVVLDLRTDRDQVKTWIHDLVGKGLFSGYINWNEGILYSQDASLLKTDKCPNCGGQIELAGKGVSQCPFCGTEIFLS